MTQTETNEVSTGRTTLTVERVMKSQFEGFRAEANRRALEMFGIRDAYSVADFFKLMIVFLAKHEHTFWDELFQGV